MDLSMKHTGHSDDVIRHINSRKLKTPQHSHTMEITWPWQLFINLVIYLSMQLFRDCKKHLSNVCKQRDQQNYLPWVTAKYNSSWSVSYQLCPLPARVSIIYWNYCWSLLSHENLWLIKRGLKKRPKNPMCGFPSKMAELNPFLKHNKFSLELTSKNFILPFSPENPSSKFWSNSCTIYFEMHLEWKSKLIHWRICHAMRSSNTVLYMRWSIYQ